MKDTDHRIRRRLRIFWKRYYATIVFLGIAGGLLLYATQIEPRLFHTVIYDVTLPENASTELDNFKIVFLSDFHLDQWMLQRLPEIQKTIEELHPDLILLGGDYVNKNGNGLTADFLRDFFFRLSQTAPAGTYAVLGNHDELGNKESVKKAIEQANVTLLNNQSARIQHHGKDLLNLIGIGCDTESAFLRDPEILQKTIRNDLPNLLLIHNPCWFRYVPPTIFLTVAGHTHGGQLAIPGVGPLLKPAHPEARKLRGIFQEDGRSLIVSTGLNAGSFHIRFGTMPEILLIRLHIPVR